MFPTELQCVRKPPHLYPKVLKSLLFFFVCVLPTATADGRHLMGWLGVSSISLEELQVLLTAEASFQHSTQNLIRVL